MTDYFEPWTGLVNEILQANRPAVAPSIATRRSGTHVYYVGLDLGQAQDYTAIAVLEKHQPTREVVQTMTDSRNHEWTRRVTEVSPVEYHCRHLERLTLGTSYPDVVRHVAALLDTPPLRHRSALVVDATGVGRPVVDMLRAARLEPIALTITGGDSVVSGPGGLRVPKRDLVGAAQVLLQSKRLKIAGSLAHANTLVEELLAYRVKISELTAHDSYNAREGAHDDLVLALAVACWWGERDKPRPIATSWSYVTP